MAMVARRFKYGFIGSRFQVSIAITIALGILDYCFCGGARKLLTTLWWQLLVESISSASMKLVNFATGNDFMATLPTLRMDNLLAALNEAEIAQHPVEVHGALVGLICGGVEQSSKGWTSPLLELMNDGQALPPKLQLLIEELYQDAVTRLSDTDFGFNPMLPEEEEPISKRVEALSLWVQSFLTGIAIIQPKLNKASKEVREVIQDLSEIAQVEFDVAEDDESEAALIELMEFTRMAALLCYSEFGPAIEDDKPIDLGVLH